MNEKVFKSNKHRTYTWTLNNYLPQDVEQIIEWGKVNCPPPGFVKWKPQKGLEKQTPHFQGMFHFKSPRSFNFLKEAFPRMSFKYSRSIKSASDYIDLDETYDPSGISYSSWTKEVKDPLSDKQLYPWQSFVLNLFTTQTDRRTVWWFVDTLGGKGKTTLAVHMWCLYPKNIFYTSGKPPDVKYGIKQFHMKDDNDCTFVIFDLTRMIVDHKSSYQAIEEVKNGIMYSPKFESGMFVMNPPQVVVFANHFPIIQDTLSVDRFKIHEILPDNTFRYYPVEAVSIKNKIDELKSRVTKLSFESSTLINQERISKLNQEISTLKSELDLLLSQSN